MIGSAPGLLGRLDLRPLVYGDEPLAAYRGCSSRGPDVGRAVLPEELRAALVAGSRKTNRSFFTEFLPDLPPDSYGDDAATALLAQCPCPCPCRCRCGCRAPHAAMRSLAGTAGRILRRGFHRGA